MKLQEICDMDIPSDDNSALYLWTTSPKLLEGIKVMESWGFTYKSQAVWDKERVGMGYWFRGQHEILLVGTKGKFSPPPSGLRTASVYRYKRGKHSKKPDEIRNLISSWYPDLDRLELFCRFPAEGWDAFGNEIENSISLPNTQIDSQTNNKS